MSELVAQVPWEADGALSGWPTGLSTQTHPPLELRYTLSVQSLVYMRRSVPAWTHMQWLGEDSCLLCSPLPPSLIPSSLLSSSVWKGSLGRGAASPAASGGPPKAVPTLPAARQATAGQLCASP